MDIYADLVDYTVPGYMKVYSGNNLYQFKLRTTATVDTQAPNAFQIMADIMNGYLGNLFSAKLDKALNPPTTPTPTVTPVDPDLRLDQLQVSASGQFTDINEALAYANSGATIVLDEGFYIIPVAAHPNLRIALVTYDPAKIAEQNNMVAVPPG